MFQFMEDRYSLKFLTENEFFKQSQLNCCIFCSRYYLVTSNGDFI